MDFGFIKMSAIKHFLPNHLTLRLAIEQQWGKTNQASAPEQRKHVCDSKLLFFYCYCYVTVIENARWLFKMMCTFFNLHYIFFQLSNDVLKLVSHAK